MKTDFSLLRDLMIQGRPKDFPVAIDRNQLLLWSKFVRDVSILRQGLVKKYSARYVLACQSSYAFAVGIMALWQEGHVAVLSPNLQPERIQESLPDTEGVLSDDSVIPKSLPIFPEGAPPLSVQWKKLLDDQVVLELWTSGSGGERKRVQKRLSQIDSELSVLEKTFGSKLKSASIFSTVSHQHIYGMLFRVLWPLAAGRSFFIENSLIWDDLLYRIKGVGNSAVMTSPTHLQRLDRNVGEALQKKGCQAIFSSGGPLERRIAHQVEDSFGQSPLEVFGSTETGGLGWRFQTCKAGDALWSPFEGVKISMDPKEKEHLLVSSPFLSEDSLSLDDRGNVHPGGYFQILGRLDRIVKFAEKRVSLDEMEIRLSLHECISKAFVGVLESSISRRQKFAVLVVLTGKGSEVVLRQGEKSLVKSLRQHLAQFYEDSTLPKLFKFYDSALPLDLHGKLTAEHLKEIFTSPSSLRVTHPTLLNKKISENTIEYSFRVPNNLIYLEGHFPSFALVPGVVQIQWVVDLVSQWQGRPLTLKSMEAVKFKEVLLRGAEFSLSAEIKKSGEKKIYFSIKNDQSLYSSGRLIYQEGVKDGESFGSNS